MDIVNKRVTLDAAQTAYFEEELTHIKDELLRKEYPENKAVQLFPVDTSTPYTAEDIKYRILDRVGNAALIMSYSKDLKKVRVFGRIERSEVRTIGSSFEYSWLDIQRAAEGIGINLPREEAMAAREANELEINDLSWYGNAEAGLNGVLTHPNVIIQPAAPVGTGSSPLWSDKTDEQILADINTAINTIMINSNGVEVPNSIVMPIEQHQIIGQELVGNDKNRSLREVILETNANIQNIDWASELKDVDLPSGSPATGDVAIFYDRNPDKCYIDIPLIFRQMDPQPDVLTYEVPCVTRYAGFVAKRPRSILILENI